MKRHKWDWVIRHRCVDGGSSTCIYCGCVKQYVKGIPTYYIKDRDVVYDKKAPNCEAVIIKVKK